MRTADVVKAISPVIKRCLADAGLSVIFLKGYQAVQQGIPSDAAIFYHMLSLPPDSWQAAYSTYNQDADNFNTNRSIQSGFTMQLTCRALISDSDEDPIYAEDILTELRNRLSPVEVVRELKKLGVGLFVPSKLTPSVQQNDEGQWEPMPVLELGLSYVSGYNTITERVKSIDGVISSLCYEDEYTQVEAASVNYSLSSEFYSDKFES